MSGGQYTGGFGNPGEYAEFAINGIPSPGTYNLKIRYASGETPTAGVVINGNSSNPILIPLPTTQSWGGNYNEVTATVPLNQGNNTIRIQGAQQTFMLDKVCVQSGGGGGRLAATDLEDDLSIQVFPNPTTSSVTVQYYVQQGQEATLSIVDLLGRETPVKKITGENRRYQETLDVDKWPSGAYMIKVKTDSQLLTKKMVISH